MVGPSRRFFFPLFFWLVSSGVGQQNQRRSIDFTFLFVVAIRAPGSPPTSETTEQVDGLSLVACSLLSTGLIWLRAQK